jgi:hypothetical protein
MSSNGIAPTFNMRPSYDATYIEPNYYTLSDIMPPVGRLMGFDNTPIKPMQLGEYDPTANLLTRMGVDRAADYSNAIAEQHAPSGRVSFLA